jgi:hypothetical protein
MLAAPLLLVSCGAGVVAFAGWSADRGTCATAREFADSLRSNRARLAAIDSVLARFDLEEGALPASADSAPVSAEPNRLERRIIALRMEGVTAAQIDRWMRTDLRLVPRSNVGRNPSGDINGQLAKIRARESDASYVLSLRSSLQVTHDYWHDLTTLSPLTARWTARCSTYSRRMAIALPLWALATSMLLLCLWWWRAAGRVSTSSR